MPVLSSSSRVSRSLRKARTFTEYYTEQVQKPIWLPVESPKTFIDREFSNIIEEKEPKQIQLFLSRKTNHNSRKYSLEETISLPMTDQKHNLFIKTFQKEQSRTMNKLENLEQLRKRLKQRLGLVKVKQEEFFSMDHSLTYIEEKYDKKYYKRRGKERMQTVGKYEEKLHPLCEIYEKEVSQVLRNVKAPFTPFGNLPTIEY